MSEYVEGAREELRGLLDECGPGATRELRSALAAGRVDGGAYWSRADGCGCVVGTLIHALRPDLDDSRNVAAMTVELTVRGCRFGEMEAWVSAIKRGHAPDHTASEGSGPFRAAVLVSWVDEWLSEREEAVRS
jgi:hypothetical protein